jgi:hypothetical protein
MPARPPSFVMSAAGGRFDAAKAGGASVAGDGHVA